MADSSIGGGSAAPESSASNRHAIIPAPIAADNQHVCFICLQNDTDTPNATWVNPCPCSLEAHEECMLDWVADMETSQGRSKNGLRCPACKAPIRIQEPYDLFIALRDGLTRRYSRLSPYILLVLVSSGGVAGASWYGWGAAAIFAGPDAVSAANLLAHDNFPTWPPSPQWAMILMPYVHLGYACLFRGLFGPLDRRLNRTLRGLRAEEPDAARREEAAPAVAAPEPVAEAADARNPEEVDGIWGAVANLGGAVLGLFRELPLEQVNVEVRINGGADDFPRAQAGQAPEAAQMLEIDEDFQIRAGNAAPEPAEQQQPAPQPEQRNQRPPRNQDDHNNERGNDINNGNDNDNNDNNDAGEVSYFRRFINNIATSLLMPAISYGMERWGRSLVGGCLFLVLQDVVALYTKYRRVQVKAKRRIRRERAIRIRLDDRAAA
ncbi:e19e0c80-968f-4d25-ba82-e30450deb32e [Thermothielavioides terrestris]|uniref:E19e0c80-968f-4d25-ba82-e30450deb32e n=1 Tax=Thermothielavioides terrestris TaxID=2587410 RepID=A0A446BN73_9PEZI|nr:e19e0c80-968f-4d25-ba82-e30450deb32e [Thermothielavioides terrestris]